MRVKAFKGKVFGADLSAKEKKAMQIEINKQILEADRKYADNIDVLILWALHRHLGFGPKRLRAFYEVFNSIHEELRDYYEMSDDDVPWIAMTKLKEMGVDVEVWNKERHHD